MKISVSLVALLGVAEGGFVKDIFGGQMFSPKGAMQHVDAPSKSNQFHDTAFHGGAQPMAMAKQQPSFNQLVEEETMPETVEAPRTLEQVRENLNGREILVTTQAGTVESPDPDVSATTFTTNQFSVQGILQCDDAQPIATTQCLSGDQYSAITSEIQHEFSSMGSNDRADFVGCILRLAGHDFMDFMPASLGAPASERGGSDGCIDFNDPDNAGLDCIGTLHTAYNDANVFSNAKVCEKVSLADFIVIAGEAVMEATREDANSSPPSAPIGFKDNFHFGRTTSFTCEWAEGRLPNPENQCLDGNPKLTPTSDTGLPGGGSSVKTNFVDALGLTWPEAATLMGVHTLGRVAKANSGYEGWWSQPAEQAKFNNNYYRSLIAKGWQKVIHNRASSGGAPIIKTQYEWTGKADFSEGSVTGSAQKFAGQPVLMLASDMCLFYNIDQIDSATNTVGRPVGWNPAGSDAWTQANGQQGNLWTAPTNTGANGHMTSCCAWNHQSGSSPNAVTNIHCGAQRSQFTGFMADLDNCCHFNNNNNVAPCNAPSNPGGKAADHVRDLATDDAVNGFPNGNIFFYSEFKKVWTKATELGHPELGNLHDLTSQCSNDPATPTDSPTLSPTEIVPTKSPTKSPTKFPTKKGDPITLPPTRFPTPAPTFGEGSEPTCWTPWFNRDTPGGTGEWETLMAHSKEHPQAFIDAGCGFDIYSNTVGTPMGVECEEWLTGSSNTGDLFTNGIKCTPEEGLVCLNSDQKYGTCMNYKVRYNCCKSAEDEANGEKTTLTFQDENEGECKMVMQGDKIVSSCPIVAPAEAEDRVNELSVRVHRIEQRLTAMEENQGMSSTQRDL